MYWINKNDKGIYPETQTTKQLIRIFDNKLLRVEEGKVIWKAKYDDYRDEWDERTYESNFKEIDIESLKNIFASNLGDSQKTMRDYIESKRTAP